MFFVIYATFSAQLYTGLVLPCRKHFACYELEHFIISFNTFEFASQNL